ncbi:MAG: hypothetical protein WD557_15275 [Dehalococcoidia bacterium]
MTDLRADPLSPIDAATLWPQLRRLATEVIATRAGENLLLSSGLAATGLTHLPRMPRTVVVGLRRGLNYRGVLVGRELAGGAGWELVSLRLVRDKDDEAVIALLNAAAQEAASRGGRTVYQRMAEGSPHMPAVRRAGLVAYQTEALYALPAGRTIRETSAFRSAGGPDRHGVFRLYCRAVPEHVRRLEAPTLQDWRAVLDSFDCESEFVLDHEGALAAWVGIGDREARAIADWRLEGISDEVLDMVEREAPRQAVIVLGEDQENLRHNALARGYTALGERLVCARRLAVLNSLKEVVAAPAESFALPQ